MNIAGGVSSTSTSGAVNIAGGDKGGGTSGDGGGVNIRGGVVANNATSAGSISVIGGTAGDGGAGGTPGSVTVAGGATIRNIASTGGTVLIRGGENDGGSGAFTGGSVTVRGGNGANGTGGGAGGAGGGCSILGGTPVEGNGGTITITGSNGVGTDRNGGDITLTPGNSTGTGSRGAIKFDGRYQGKQGTDITAANDIILTVGNYFDITGATQINTISGTDWRAGSMITLQFDSNPVVANLTAGTGAQIRLNGGANFSTTAGSTLTLIYDGTLWKEIARMTA